jgi:hypothetical protein
MAVVAAGVHLAGVARVMGKSVALVHGQGVHVGSEAYGTATAARLEYSDHSRAGETPVHLNATLFQEARHDFPGATLLESRFRVSMNIAPQASEPLLTGAQDFQ